MNRYENLEQEARDNGITVDRIPFRNQRIKGLYCDGAIAINTNIETTAERSCVLAEELGHYYTSVGNILDQADAANRKQEYRARLHAYNRQIGLMGIVRSFNAGCRTLYDMAEYLEVSEGFLKEALEAYRRKHSPYAVVDNYMIWFEPNLNVMKIM